MPSFFRTFFARPASLSVLPPLAWSLLSQLAPGSAVAAEAYLCDNNRLVYVEPEDLQRLIRTDPCIARYHGVVPAGTLDEREPLVRLTAPLAAEIAVAQQPVQSTGKAPLPTHGAAAGPTKPSVSPHHVRRGASQRAPVPGAQPVAAAPGTDFENVRVINATDEADRWFRLAR